jgi:drug/metabolite transporter (DMT)-like permease
MKSTPSHGQLLALVLLSVLWGLNWPAVKIALADVGPWTLRAAALFLAGLCLAGFALLRGHRLRVRQVHWWRVAAPSLVAIAAPNVLIANAQLHAPTGRIAVVVYTMPVWAAVLSYLLLGERLDRRRLTGLWLGLAGLLALGLPLWRSGEISIGLGLAFAAAFCWAAGTIMVKRYPADCSRLAFATWQLLIGSLCIGAGMVMVEGAPVVHQIGYRAWAAFAYHVLLGQALATAVWFEVLERIPASTATLGTLPVPAIGVFSAMLLLGERPTAADFTGLALIVAASAAVLGLAQSGVRPGRREGPPNS